MEEFFSFDHMKKLFSILIVSITLFACRNQYRGIPNVSVDVYINILDPSYSSLAGLGAWKYVNGGSKGIIVFNLDNETYLAYERHCPHDPENECSQVVVDETNLIAVDSCCMTKYQLLDGNPISGPGTIPLLTYRTSFDGNIIHIRN